MCDDTATVGRVAAPAVSLASFNAWDRHAAAAFVRPCLDVDRWVDSVVDGRPFAEVAALAQVATQAATDLSSAEIEAALAHHPRIGESASGASREATLSKGEQSGLHADDELGRQLQQGNTDYERRFGRVFLIRAAGRSASEIMATLERRLGNDDETEERIVGQQLGEIAVLRLRALVTP
ncbi:MAG: 2-oxo-4-hydroxy-4-carboxy-5-ureidoimidazoline decarboxylase [Actinomycetota bacterium]|nr:2-oxo-4-hydroxy-4-carboxy-5-ureidoimidazoline decarboxylase [Actinomycetota bacterium]